VRVATMEKAILAEMPVVYAAVDFEVDYSWK
jgi:hypothetical protein